MVSLEFAEFNSVVLLGHYHFLLQHAKGLLVVYAVPQF